MNKFLLLLASAFLLLNSCGSSMLLGGSVSEGVIEYALSFPDYDPDGLMSGMLPEKTTLSFAEDKQVSELSAGMGIFRTAMIMDNEKRAMDYHMSMMSRKIVSHLGTRDLEIFLTDRERPTIIHTDHTDTIAGFPCRRAIAIYDRIDHPEVELWYTDRIDLQDPNWFGPFAEIPGVLLRYEVVQYGIRMRLTATSVTPGRVDPALFRVKQEFQEVAPVVLHQELGDVLSTFNM
jgi:hypothetical protein